MSSVAGTPTECLKHADPAEADDARAHLAARRSWTRFAWRRKREHPKDWDTGSDTLQPPPAHTDRRLDETPGLGAQSIVLDEDSQELDGLPEDKDVYKWAVLYENQRGAYFFSTPYYSSNTLLPLDPPPYTIPSSDHVCRAQPTVAPDAYPLPDGSWRWVSRAWMVDMRPDGRVQFDGFEYAWSFRARRWRPRVGPLSAAGWVRRRRWVRLMVRPARSTLADERVERATGPPELLELSHTEAGATRPPSVVATAVDESDEEQGELWRGDDGDWLRCRMVLKDLSRDGQRLELWKRWLDLPLASPSVVGELEARNVTRSSRSELPAIAEHELAEHVAQAGSSSDVDSLVEVASKDAVAAVLRRHAEDIMKTFVYPDSRAQFVELMTAAGLVGDLHAGLGVSDTKDILDFWSYGDP